MGGNDFILDTKMVQGEDIIRGFAFKGVEILDCEVIKFIPFKFKAWTIIL